MREQLKLKVVLGVGIWSALAFLGGGTGIMLDEKMEYPVGDNSSSFNHFIRRLA